MSPFFCGEGAPDWIVPVAGGIAKFPLPVGLPYKTDSRGYPSPSDCGKKEFGVYYPTEAVGQAFQALYVQRLLRCIGLTRVKS